MSWETGADEQTLLVLCIKWITTENLLRSTGTVLTALRSPKWDRKSKNKVYKYTCD